MTNLEALVSISQILMRVNGRWCVGFQRSDESLRRDIRATVYDTCRLLRDVGRDQDSLIADAIAELERRASLPEAA